MTPGNYKGYQFGSFLLDTDSETLYKDGEPVNLQRKWYDILLCLVGRAGEVVRKEELIEQVWQGKEIDERNLTQHIYNLRRALGDNPRIPSFILTVPGKGYTFNHPVTALVATDLDAILNRDSPNPEEEGSAPAGTPRSGWVGRLPNAIRSRFTLRYALRSGVAILVLSTLLLVTHPSWWRSRKAVPGRYPRLTTLTTVSGLKIDPSFSPDGRQIAFASGRSGNNLDIYVTSFGQRITQAPVRLTSSPLSDHDPVWSPDGRQIAFLRGNHYDQARMELLVVPSTGGSEKLIASVWGGLDWSPDGRHLAVIDEESPLYPTTLYLISSDGAQRQRLTEPVPGEWRFDSTPRFSPDGRSIAFIRWRGDIDGDIWVVDIQSKQQRQVTFDRKQIADLRWSQDGQEILFISGRSGTGQLWRQKIGQKTPTLIDSVVGDILRFDLHPEDPKLVFTQYSQNTSIEVWPLVGSAARGNEGTVPQAYPEWTCRIDSMRDDMDASLQTQSGQILTVASSRNYLNPRFSPDGKRILFISNQSGMNQIWTANADCSDPTQLTNIDFEGLGSPRWSPDGKRVAFDGRKNGTAELFVIDSTGANLRVVNEGYMPAWSMDGKYLYFVSNQMRVPHIWKVPAAGGEAVIVTTSHSRDPLESADGKWLYFSSIDRLWQKDLVTGTESPVPGLENVAINRYWDVTSEGIYFVTTDEDSFGFKLHRFDLRTKKVTILLDFRGIVARWVPGISVGPGGQSIAISYLGNVLGDIQILDDWN